MAVAGQLDRVELKMVLLAEGDAQEAFDSLLEAAQELRRVLQSFDGLNPFEAATAGATDLAEAMRSVGDAADAAWRSATAGAGEAADAVAGATAAAQTFRDAMQSLSAQTYTLTRLDAGFADASEAAIALGNGAGSARDAVMALAATSLAPLEDGLSGASALALRGTTAIAAVTDGVRMLATTSVAPLQTALDALGVDALAGARDVMSATDAVRMLASTPVIALTDGLGSVAGAAGDAGFAVDAARGTVEELASTPVIALTDGLDAVAGAASGAVSAADDLRASVASVADESVAPLADSVASLTDGLDAAAAAADRVAAAVRGAAASGGAYGGAGFGGLRANGVPVSPEEAQALISGAAGPGGALYGRVFGTPVTEEGAPTFGSRLAAGFKSASSALGKMNAAVNEFGTKAMTAGIGLAMAGYAVQAVINSTALFQGVQGMQALNPGMTPTEAERAMAMMGSQGMSGTAGESALTQMAATIQQTLFTLNGQLSRQGLQLTSLGINRSIETASPWMQLKAIAEQYRRFTSRGLGQDAANLLRLTGTQQFQNLFLNWGAATKAAQSVGLGMSTAQVNQAAASSIKLGVDWQNTQQHLSAALVALAPAFESLLKAVNGVVDALAGHGNVFQRVGDAAAAVYRNLGLLGSAFLSFIATVKLVNATLGLLRGAKAAGQGIGLLRGGAGAAAGGAAAGRLGALAGVGTVTAEVLAFVAALEALKQGFELLPPWVRKDDAALQNFAQNAPLYIADFVRTTAGMLSRWATLRVEDFTEFVTGSMRALSGWVGKAVSAVRTQATDLVNAVMTAIGDAIRGAKSIGGTAVRFVDAVVASIEDAVKGAAAKGGQFVSAAVSFVDSLVSAIKNAIEGLPADLAAIGATLGSDVAAMIRNAMEHLPVVGGLMSNLLKNVPHGAQGGIAGGLGGLPKIAALAAGGYVSAPTLALIGEAGPEAVIPLTRYPLNPSAAHPGMFPRGFGPSAPANSGGVTIIVNVTSTSENPRLMGEQIAQAVQARIIQTLKLRGNFDMSYG